MLAVVDCPLVNLDVKGTECCFDVKPQTSHINGLLNLSQVTYLNHWESAFFKDGNKRHNSECHTSDLAQNMSGQLQHSDWYFSTSEDIL